jgi:general stress protein YciG
MNRPNPSEPTHQQEQGGQFEDSLSRTEKKTSDAAESDKKVSTRSNNPGRFDNDPERARIAGRKGGENPKNAGRFDNNPARAREAGQKGGQSSQAARHAAAKNRDGSPASAS